MIAAFTFAASMLLAGIGLIILSHGGQMDKMKLGKKTPQWIRKLTKISGFLFMTAAIAVPSATYFMTGGGERASQPSSNSSNQDEPDRNTMALNTPSPSPGHNVEVNIVNSPHTQSIVGDNSAINGSTDGSH